MEENKKELKQEELEPVSGGSIFYTEASVKKAGIELRKEDGTPGEFGYIWNSGDYYYKGQRLHGCEVDAVIQYREKMGAQAPSLQEAKDFFYHVGRYAEDD